MKKPYKGDWRVKEYKPYTEKLEEYVDTMEGQLDVLLVVIEKLEERLTSEWVVLPVPSSLHTDPWMKTRTNLWP